MKYLYVKFAATVSRNTQAYLISYQILSVGAFFQQKSDPEHSGKLIKFLMRYKCDFEKKRKKRIKIKRQTRTCVNIWLLKNN